MSRVRNVIVFMTILIAAATMLAVQACGGGGNATRFGNAKTAQSETQTETGTVALNEEYSDLDDVRGEGKTVDGIEVIPVFADKSVDERALASLRIESCGESVSVSLTQPLPQGDVYFGLYDERGEGLACTFSGEVIATSAIATAVPVREGRTDDFNNIVMRLQ